MRFLIFAGNIEPFRTGENTFIGESPDLSTARQVAFAHGTADWYLIYDRTSRQLTRIPVRESSARRLNSAQEALVVQEN